MYIFHRRAVMLVLACRVIHKMLISEFMEFPCCYLFLIMSGNNDLCAGEGLSIKGKWSLLEKVEILCRLDMGMNIAVVRCGHGAK